jgi:hypothetical protein
MPSESIGCVGSAQWPDQRGIELELEIAIAFLRALCGPEPDGCSLEIIWHDHDSGQWANIELTWNEGEHWRYVSSCQTVLDRLDDCASWSELAELRDEVATRAEEERIDREQARLDREEEILERERRRFGSEEPAPANGC